MALRILIQRINRHVYDSSLQAKVPHVTLVIFLGNNLLHSI